MLELKCKSQLPIKKPILLRNKNKPTEYTQMSGPWGLIRQKTQIMMCTPEYLISKVYILGCTSLK